MNQSRALRTQRQLQFLTQRMQRELASTGGQVTSKMERWSQHVRRLAFELRGLVSRAWMRRTLAGVATVVGLLATDASAQNFAPTVPNGFGAGPSSPSNSFSDFELVDLDGDGDLDLVGKTFAYDYYGYYPTIQFQQNVGTASAPDFAAPSTDPFGAITGLENWDLGVLYGGLAMDVTDLDGDGDFDLLFVQQYGYAYNYNPYEYGYFMSPIVWVENTGTPTAPAFGTAEINPFGLDIMMVGQPGDVGIFGLDCVDLDGDGDLDVVGAWTDFDVPYGSDEVTHGIFWCENTGSATNPAFAAAAVAPFGLHDTATPGASEGLAFHLEAVDLDGDGDMDLVESLYFGYSSYDYLTSLHFIENVGSAGAPAFAAPAVSPFALEVNLAQGLLVTHFADIDGDGDFDALHNNLLPAVNGNANTISFQENLGGVSVSEFMATDFTLYPNPVARGGAMQIEGLEPGDFTITDLRGARVAAGRYVGGTLGVSDLPAGFYVLTVSQPDGAQARKTFEIAD